MDDRTLRYNVLADYRFQNPVESVVVLLRQEAAQPAMKGNVYRTNRRGIRYLAFEYDIVRLWEIPVDRILEGPFGVLATSPLAQVDEDALPDVIRRMSTRISVETLPAEAAEIWTAVYVLMGLKYPAVQTRRLLKGVMGMEESTTYQEILRKGVEQGEAIGVMKGEAIGLQESILRIGSKRFGQPEDLTVKALRAIESVPLLQRLVDRLLEVESWTELLNRAK